MHSNQRIRASIITAAVFAALSIQAQAADEAVKPGDKLSGGLPEVYTIKKTPSVKSDLDQVDRVKAANATPTGMPPLPNVPLADPKQIKEESFQSVINKGMPMTPEQIARLRQLLDDQQRAKSTLPYVPPKPVVSTMVVRGEPGETPPVVRLSRNFVSSLVFSDASGAPWPITSFGAGNDDMFSVANPDPKNANVLTVSTGSAYAYGNVHVSLLGRPSPIMITLVADQKYVDYQANITVQARGPNAVAPTTYAGNSFQNSPALTSFLDGIPPEKSVPLEVSDQRVQAWKLNNKFYIRTKMALYSPAWSNHHASPDGMHAYEITPTPVIVSGENGHPQQIKIGE
ncbi:MAG: type IV secretion protein IcmK [Methylotenera sp.]|uniref:DotH/IcmK family type IV secretion protein n=1 Tax=Methylotenera sp. TaxID=2051956 RepID=UPI000D4ED4F2|nr:DotH/IcmK family type IV secretion protein [Methylotenera sp.]PPC84766.1 MAG: type IV secretion protein IcmK [Methylotenera sp.]PPD02125.1 MAG: type IV secretion protein IcmK [Methylotenera sp.]